MVQLPSFHNKLNMLQVMVVCFMRSDISNCGCACSDSSTPRYLACLTRLIFLLLVKLVMFKPL